MADEIKKIDGGITAAKGFSASGIHAGLKASSADMAMIFSETPATAAGVFTTNAIQAAPVKLCRDIVNGNEPVRAVVINSGCANACTGSRGVVNAAGMAKHAESVLNIPSGSVLVASTGCIGTQLPMDRILAGITKASENLSSDGSADAARAIMTTDTRPKEYAVEVVISGVPVRVGGITKGSGMIHPMMATMLGFITTDAAVEQSSLQAALAETVNISFNRISVDGDQSTNDTVLLMANGESGCDVLNDSHPEWALFLAALKKVALYLAHDIVKDGEGATKFVSVHVKGAASAADAETAARSVANSLLVKTSWFGCDPNWGRVIDAVGYSGCYIEEEKTDISYDDVFALVNGEPAGISVRSDLINVMKQAAFTVTVDLKVGAYSDTIYTCDCSYEYVRINAEYTT